MSEDGVPKFDHILVPRAALPVDKPLSFELFVKIAERFVKVANKDEAVDIERLNRYLEHERDVLYIDRGSLERFMDEKFGIMYDMIADNKVHAETRFEWFIRCLELGFVDLKVVRPHPDKFMRIDLLVQWSFDFFRKRELRKVLVKQIFKSLEQPISKRAIFGTAMTLNLILDHSDVTPSAYRSLFLGCLYRDLSVSQEADFHTLAIDAFPNMQTRDDFQKHPLQSMDILRQFNIVDDIIRSVVEQHHEQPRGNGFPRGLKRAETFQAAQYLGLSDLLINEIDLFKKKNGFLSADGFLDHLKHVVPEENQKNLPILVRAMREVF